MSRFVDKYTAEERNEISKFMSEIGWIYWSEKDMDKWEQGILFMYHLIMSAGERKIVRTEIGSLRKTVDDLRITAARHDNQLWASLTDEQRAMANEWIANNSMKLDAQEFTD